MESSLVHDLTKRVKYRAYLLPKSASKPPRIVLALQRPKAKVLAFEWPFHNKKPRHSKKPQPLIAVTGNYHRTPKVIIVIDPGHGGKDPGATGPGGNHEKTVVLAISRQLKKLIDKQPGFVAKLTRRGNYFISLRTRLAIARRDHADMFIAIHADAYRNRDAHGASVFALSQRGATSEAARWLAERENKSELMGGVNLNDKNRLLKSVLINLSQTATIRASLRIGADIINSLGKIARLHHRRVEQAAFVVLKSPDIPSLLVESGFITNPQDEMRLTSAAYQHSLALALSNGIIYYFRLHPPRGTWLAKQKHKKQQYERKQTYSHS